MEEKLDILPVETEMPEAETSPAKMAAAEEVMKAFESKDPMALISALDNYIEINSYESMPKEEDESGED